MRSSKPVLLPCAVILALRRVSWNSATSGLGKQLYVGFGGGSQGAGFLGQADAGIAFDDSAHVFRALVAHCRPAFELAVTLEFQYIEQWRVATWPCRPVGVEIECGQ